ncbi:MAG: ABC transporter ATP-binding protein [Candidatus Hydrothermia bacterium]
MKVVEVDNLTFTYDPRSFTPVLRDINFNIEQGDFVAIIGPNGSGKTTLFKLLTGIIKIPEPAIKIWGRPINTFPRKDLVQFISALPSTEIIENQVLKVQDYLELARYPYLKNFQSLSKIDYSIIETAKKVTQIQRLSNKYLWEISHGELTRVRIARVLAQDSKIIIMDEPTAHLDVDHKLWLLGTLRRLKSNGKTVVTIIHDVNLAYKYADKLIILNSGAIEFYGSKGDLDLKLLENVFNVRIKKYHDELIFEESF